MKRRMPRAVKIILWVLLSLVLLLVAAVIALVIVYETRTVDVPAVQRAPATAGSYAIVGTGQLTFWNSAGTEISAPA
jgi:hypothetical protein